mmetsp:Transcript_47387/g.122590  ORF Transcript_47387/g.122590 Transcript_47387/m.122590 type:complete len:343 (+) Transcript_47387:2276-3304(+)
MHALTLPHRPQYCKSSILNLVTRMPALRCCVAGCSASVCAVCVDRASLHLGHGSNARGLTARSARRLGCGGSTRRALLLVVLFWVVDDGVHACLSRHTHACGTTPLQCGVRTRPVLVTSRAADHTQAHLVKSVLIRAGQAVRDVLTNGVRCPNTELHSRRADTREGSTCHISGVHVAQLRVSSRCDLDIIGEGEGGGLLDCAQAGATGCDEAQATGGRGLVGHGEGLGEDLCVDSSTRLLACPVQTLRQTAVAAAGARRSCGLARLVVALKRSFSWAPIIWRARSSALPSDAPRLPCWARLRQEGIIAGRRSRCACSIRTPYTCSPLARADGRAQAQIKSAR